MVPKPVDAPPEGDEAAGPPLAANLSQGDTAFEEQVCAHDAVSFRTRGRDDALGTHISFHAIST